MAKLVHLARCAEARRNHLRVAILAAPALALALSACTRTSNLNQGAVTAQPRASNLTPAPPPPVSGSQLPAPTTETAQIDDPLKPVDPVDPNAPTGVVPVQEPTEVASATPADGGKPVTRNELLGAWTVASGGANCQIFLTLTKWSGGFRAASRACPAPLSSVQAWDVKGKQVVLVNQSGGTAATLFRSADSRYDGSTSSGSAISLSR